MGSPVDVAVFGENPTPMSMTATEARPRLNLFLDVFTLLVHHIERVSTRFGPVQILSKKHDRARTRAKPPTRWLRWRVLSAPVTFPASGTSL